MMLAGVPVFADAVAESLSGELVTEAPRGFADMDRADETSQPAAKRKHRTSPGVDLVLGFVVLGLVGWAWDAAHHDHGGAHAAPASIAEIQLATDGPFLADDGASVTVAGAVCTGDGEPVDSGFTHFGMLLAFDDGTVTRCSSTCFRTASFSSSRR